MGQIFDNDKVVGLIRSWQSSKDKELLESILMESTNLIEAIVSGYDNIYRDDLIQESYLRIQYSLAYYDPNISTAHNYLTTVIRNVCCTYLTKNSKISNNAISIDDLELIPDGYQFTEDEMSGILEDLIIRNRKRFPSIKIDVIDDITELLYERLTAGNRSIRSIVQNMCDEFHMSRQVITVIYHSTLFYLRSKYSTYGNLAEVYEPEEMSMLYDLWQLVGDDMYIMLSHYFSGMYLKFPS